MPITTGLVESLLWEDESNTLDFKEEQYPFAGATDQQKGEIIKDILAFANAFRREDAYILLGVRDIKGGRGIVIGVTHHLDDANLQQLVNTKTNRTVEFNYHAIEIDHKQVGVIRIPQQDRPSYITKNYGKLRASDVYVRHGSSTAVATPEEIKRMGAEEAAAPRQGIDPEIAALNAVHQYARFHERVARLIDEISRLPDHFIAMNPRPPEHDRERRALMAAFQQDYDRFRTAMSTARDLLREREALVSVTEKNIMESILTAMTEVCSSVEAIVATASEKYAIQHTSVRDTARNAADNLSTLVARRLIVLGTTPHQE